MLADLAALAHSDPLSSENSTSLNRLLGELLQLFLLLPHLRDHIPSSEFDSPDPFLSLISHDTSCVKSKPAISETPRFIISYVSTKSNETHFYSFYITHRALLACLQDLHRKQPICLISTVGVGRRRGKSPNIQCFFGQDIKNIAHEQHF